MGNWREYALSGYLAPDGIYYECEYERHYKLAQELVVKYDLGIRKPDANQFGEFIKFGCYPWVSSKEGDAGCHVFVTRDLTKPPTKKQLDWLAENWWRMTAKQQRYVYMGLYSHHLWTKEYEASLKHEGDGGSEDVQGTIKVHNEAVVGNADDMRPSTG